MRLVLSVASIYFRYLLILFRDAPVEVWAMTKTPIMVSFCISCSLFAISDGVMFAIVHGVDKFEILSIDLVQSIHFPVIFN